jgi:hypothetical protein
MARDDRIFAADKALSRLRRALSRALEAARAMALRPEDHARLEAEARAFARSMRALDAEAREPALRRRLDEARAARGETAAAARRHSAALAEGLPDRLPDGPRAVGDGPGPALPAVIEEARARRRFLRAAEREAVRLRALAGDLRAARGSARRGAPGDLPR